VFPHAEETASVHEAETPVLNGLRSIDNTDDLRQDGFPQTKEIPKDHADISQLMRLQACDHAGGRQVMKGPGRRYDITACDLFDSNIDFLFVPSKHILYVRLLSHDLTQYGVISVLVLVIIVFIAEELAQEISNSRNGNNAPTQSRMLLMIAVWSTLLILSLNMQFGSQRSARAHAIVTDEEKYNLFALFAYIIMYTAFWVADVWKFVVESVAAILGKTLGLSKNVHTIGATGHSRNHGINSMLATTFFAIQVLTGSTDNIYSQPFFFVFLYRVLYKVYGVMNGNDFRLLDRSIVGADIVFLTIFFQFSFLPAYTHYSEAVLRACTLFAIANAMALVIHRNDTETVPVGIPVGVVVAPAQETRKG
jgi:hypothetical protein